MDSYCCWNLPKFYRDHDHLDISCVRNRSIETKVAVNQGISVKDRLFSYDGKSLETGKIDLEYLASRIKELRSQQKELEKKRNGLLDAMNESLHKH
jgi:hypothetical protein